MGQSSSGLKIKRHAHDIGHVQSTQPNTPCTFSQVLWSILREYPCLSMHKKHPGTYMTLNFSFSLKPDEIHLLVGWKASLITTNVLFQRIYKTALMIQQDEKSTQIYIRPI